MYCFRDDWRRNGGDIHIWHERIMPGCYHNERRNWLNRTERMELRRTGLDDDD
jgi:hypothetical protein